jgi:Phosphotransferase enzyme family
VKDELYSGFQWNYFSSLSDGPIRERANSFLLSVDWQALLNYAANVRNGVECTLLSHIGLGHNHMVRIIRFMDEVQWVARLRLPSLKDGEKFSDIAKSIECEASTIAFVRQRTRVPVPEVYAFESDSNCSAKAPFMLMECLNGNVGMDLGMEVPPEHQQAFFKGLAEIHVSKSPCGDTATYFVFQVELSTVQLPMIGTIQRINEDGTIQQGPIPGLGGPFPTATEFFKAWCAKVNFGLSNKRLHEACGSYAAELIPNITSFPTKLAMMASRLSDFDKGPFPLIHGDFGHNNVVVNNDYQIIGVIDWEKAFAAPWEVAGDYPLTLSTVPPAMDAPSNYNEMGKPTDPILAKKFASQKDYIANIKDAEDARSITELPRLLNLLQDSCKQRLITAMMRLYPSGKVGFYSNLVPEVS